MGGNGVWFGRAVKGGVCAIALACGAVVACSKEEAEDIARPVDGAVSAGSREATQAGLDMLARGGNAVDAAVAASLALGVTEPASSGLGGSGVLLLHTGEGKTVVIRADSGAAAPSLLAVLHHAWTRYGSGHIPWTDVVAPAIRAAREGYPLGRYSQTAVAQNYARILADPGASALLLGEGRSIAAEATVVQNPDLATTLELIAAEGPEAFYEGTLAQTVAKGVQARGLAAPRLGEARVAEGEAASGAYRDAIVWVPKGREGKFVLNALRFLEQVPLEELTVPGSVRTSLLSEALAYGWTSEIAPTDLGLYLDSLPPLPEPDDALGSPWSAPVAPASRPAVRGAPTSPRSTGIDLIGLGDQGSHISVVDSRGNAVSLTQTLGRPFGSGFVVPGLGFFYLDPTALERSLWAIPSLVTKSGRVELVLGSGGGERALSAVTELLIRYLDEGLALGDAVLAPRLHVSPPSGNARGSVYLEDAVWTDTLSVRDVAYATWGWGVDRTVEQRGFTLGEHDSGPKVHDLDPWFGGLNAIGWNGEGWTAIGDERRDGAGGVVRGGAPSLQSGPAGVTTPPEVRGPGAPRLP